MSIFPSTTVAYTTVKNGDSLNSQNLKFISSESSQIRLEQSIWDVIEQSEKDTFELNIEISGYRIIATEINPIEYDKNGQLFMTMNDKGFINLELILEFGSYKFENIMIRGNLVIDSNGNYYISYNLDDPKKGFFMDVSILPRSIYVDLAFDGGYCQLCYEGNFDQGYEMIPPLLPHTFEPTQMIDKFSNEIISKNRINAIFINNQKYLEKYADSNYGLRSVPYTKYGISHECFDFGVSYPEDLPDDYWEPYTAISIGIYRYCPAEALVKSDLQYYNKDFIKFGSGYIHDVKAYCMGTHGGPHWGIYNDDEELTGTIYPSEISDLWYHTFNPYSGEIDVYPWYTIIMSDSCYGYYKPPSTTPTMAKAFVDYHASAFVGATITVPGASDTYMRAFWYDLCQGNYNVQHATITLCNTYGHSWNLGDEWRIYGNQDATLP